MANTNLSLIPQNFPVTVNMLVVLKGAEKMETEMKAAARQGRSIQEKHGRQRP